MRHLTYAPIYRRHLRALWQTQVLPADIVTGAQWYPVARATVNRWAIQYGHAPATVACVIAAVSPQLDWARNLLIAEDIIAGGLPSLGGGLPANIRKAVILRDTHATSTLDLFPSGPKVASFAFNLMGSDAHVTVDAHALQAAMNNPLHTLSVHAPAYEVFANAYRAVAKEWGWSPAAFQAVIWTTWKRLYPRETKKSIGRAHRAKVTRSHARRAA